MTEAVPEPIAQGRFLVEVAAVQRGVPDGLVSVVRFGADSAEVTAEVGAARRVSVFALEASRREIAAELFPGAVPAGEAEGFPAVAPPQAAYAAILHDLGANSDALAEYLGGALRYSEVSTDGRSEAVVVIGEATAHLSLTSGAPPVGLPYTLVEQMRASSDRPPAPDEILQGLITRA